MLRKCVLAMMVAWKQPSAAPSRPTQQELVHELARIAPRSPVLDYFRSNDHA